MSGAEIRERIITSDVKIWEVAKAFGVTDSTFSRKLRDDFDEADTEKLLSIIDELGNKKRAS